MALDLTPFEINMAMRRTSAELLAANAELKTWAQNYSQAHSGHKMRYAQVLLASKKPTDTQRKAEADEVTAGSLLQSDLADGMRQASLELVRSLRAILSSLQTEARGEVEESQYYRTGPQYQK